MPEQKRKKDIEPQLPSCDTFIIKQSQLCLPKYSLTSTKKPEYYFSCIGTFQLQDRLWMHTSSSGPGKPLCLKFWRQPLSYKNETRGLLITRLNTKENIRTFPNNWACKNWIIQLMSHVKTITHKNGKKKKTNPLIKNKWKKGHITQYCW